MAKKRDSDDNDPYLCAACGSSVLYHCTDCGECRCKGGNACSEVRARRYQV